MFEKCKLRKRIRRCKNRITYLENKRIRSQAALVEAILQNIEPCDEDVDYFNKYTNAINEEREALKNFSEELKNFK